MIVEVWEEDLKFFQELLTLHEYEMRKQLDAPEHRVGKTLRKAIELEIKRTNEAKFRLDLSLESGNDSAKLNSDFESLFRSIRSDGKECALSAAKSIAKVCGVNI